MRFRATKLTAAVSGAWAALGIATFGALGTQVLPNGMLSGIVYALVLVVFLFAPLFLFVIGTRSPGVGLTAHMWHFLVRGVFWILGGALVAMPLMPFLAWLKSH